MSRRATTAHGRRKQLPEARKAANATAVVGDVIVGRPRRPAADGSANLFITSNLPPSNKRHASFTTPSFPHPYLDLRPDAIVSTLGDLGPWQLWVCLLIFVAKLPTGTVSLSMVFFTAPTNAECVAPANISDACDVRCTEVAYDRSIFEETIVTQFDLICGRKWLGSLAQMLVMGGILVGSMSLGILSDKYGRRPVFVYICIVQTVAGLAVSLSPTFWLFCLFRFLDAAAVGGIIVTSFVIVMEIVGSSKRDVMSILYQIPFNMGHALLALFAFYLRHWRWFNFGFSVISVFHFVYIWTIPESPRWLLANGRIDDAAAILEKGAIRNRRSTANIRADLENAYAAIDANAPKKKNTTSDLLRSPNMRLKTLVMAFEWLVVCMAYYGVSQYVAALGGDIFVNVAVGGCLGIPGTILCVPMTKYLGRRYTLFLSNLLSATSLIGLALLALAGHGQWQVILATIGLFGASVSIPNIYLYSGELFPTVVRNSGVGLCSMVGRIGSMTAPFISALGDTGLWLPPFIFGTSSLIAALCVLLLPETRGAPLPDTIDDGENFGKRLKAKN